MSPSQIQSIEFPPFSPPGWMRNAHFQTLVASRKPRRWGFGWETWEPLEVNLGPDGKILAEASWQPGRPADHPVVFLLHGLERSARSHYMIGMSRKAFAAGFHVVRVNTRNCGGTEHLTPTLYLFRLGGIWLGVCWSFALADRINLLKAETESANRDLQVSEARYRRLVETMNDGLGVIDGDGRYTYANDRFAEMLGKLMMDFADEDNQQILIDQLSKRKLGRLIPMSSPGAAKTARIYTPSSHPCCLLGISGNSRALSP